MGGSHIKAEKTIRKQLISLFNDKRQDTHIPKVLNQSIQELELSFSNQMKIIKYSGKYEDFEKSNN